ncbi:MAG: hypothetical protein DRJ05_11795 [Bacteroidetes bacterium]|nr:MAG: hypothetical protein DRJ05_11795 [Bacteroidota bacterium]
MNTGTYQISLSYSQILNLVKQLPSREKLKLSKELAKETVDKRLSKLLNSFRTEDISEDEINNEVEKVRAELYARNKKN